MIKNILYLFRITNGKLWKIALGEYIHGLFIGVPTGVLIFIIWELFKPEPDVNKIWKFVLIIVFMFIGQLYVAQKVMVTSGIRIYEMTSKLRILLGDHLQQLSLGFYKKRDPGDLASVILQDVSNFELIFAHSIQEIFAAIFGAIFLSLFLFYIDWELAIVLLLALPITFSFVFIGGLISNQFNEKYIRSRNEVSSRFIEYIHGIQHLKAFNQTGSRFSSLKNSFDELRVNAIKMELVPGPFILTSFVIFEFFFLLMVYLGVGRIANETITTPAFIAVLIVGYKLYDPLKLVMVNYAMLRYMNVSAERIIALLKSPLQDSGKDIIPNSYGIEFKNVTFSYIDRKILKDVSFTLPHRGLTALVGASGSGKTTIANLIARFWDVEKGEVLIGGESVKDMSPRNVYGLISQVFQDVYLFDDTIYNNIKIGNLEATKEEIMEVAEKARVVEFLDLLPNGMETKVGEGGAHLSGGQKQRISIARALLKDAPIVLLDEATASLDPENEVYIQEAIQELVKEKTVIVIAHKLQTVKNATKIIVLEEGKIKEEGQHDALLKEGGLYASYWNTQQHTRGWALGNS